MLLGIIVLAIWGFWWGSALLKSIAGNIDPYKTYVDKSPDAQPARRGYFFGPCTHQFLSIARGYQKNLSGIFRAKKRAFLLDILRGILFMSSLVCFLPTLLLGYVLLGVVCLCLNVVGKAVCCLFILLGRLLDFISRRALRVSSTCDYCKQKFSIPAYECPHCYARHTHLTPGFYGIWRRTCACGHTLPTSSLNGRSGLQAFCPHCGDTLSASDVQHLPISIIGPTSAGKTVLLSAFFHELFAAIGRSGITYEIPAKYKHMFDDMERWFNGAPCDPTAFADTASTYSVLLDAAQFRARKQLSIYDIAGESFRDSELSGMLPQMQFKYANGFILIIDPLNAELMRSEAESNGDDITNYSEMDVAAVIMNFVTYIKTNLSHTALSKIIQTPISVVITKTDLPSVKRRISYVHIRHQFKSGAFPDFGAARDELCRRFLDDIGLSEAIQAVEANFSNVHYYPVSAIGHEMNGEAYEPEHVFEPFASIISAADPSLAGILKLQ